MLFCSDLRSTGALHLWAPPGRAVLGMRVSWCLQAEPSGAASGSGRSYKRRSWTTTQLASAMNGETMWRTSSTRASAPSLCLEAPGAKPCDRAPTSILHSHIGHGCEGLPASHKDGVGLGTGFSEARLLLQNGSLDWTFPHHGSSVGSAARQGVLPLGFGRVPRR